jgi:S1-C subfamily serine protease
MKMTVLTDIETAIGEVAERVGPAVVGLGRGWGGSGVVIEPGRVLTNAHNLRHDEVTVTFADGRREEGRVTAADGDVDVAVIEVDTGEVQPIEWAGEAGVPVIGRSVLALANPAVRAGGGSPARSSTPHRCRAAHPAGHWSTTTGACSGSTRSEWTEA